MFILAVADVLWHRWRPTHDDETVMHGAPGGVGGVELRLRMD
jgi:hypothetical protein